MCHTTIITVEKFHRFTRPSNSLIWIPNGRWALLRVFQKIFRRKISTGETGRKSCQVV